MNITILNGSPRRGGNTDCLCEAFRSGVGNGHSVSVFNVADMNIGPCNGCNACFAEGHHCRQRDDMQQLYTALSQTDMLVIASPVYFYGVSAQLAAAIHRLHNPIRDTYPIRSAVLLLSAASRKPHICDGIVLQYSMLLKNFGIEDKGQVVAQGVKAPGEVLQTPFVQQAIDLGKKILPN